MHALLHMPQVLLADRVPAIHILVHAIRITRRFRGGEGGARLGDAALEAVLVDFLCARMSEMRVVGEDGLVLFDAHIYECPGVAEGGLLADLLHDGLLWVGHIA